MTAITEFLFPAPARRSVGGIVAWWEARRLPYNLIVGGAGVVSLGVVSIVANLPPDAHDGDIPILPVIVFAVLANLCYLLGPVVEIAIEKGFDGRVLPAGPTLYRMGLTFSVGLALLPTVIIGIDWVYRVLHALI